MENSQLLQELQEVRDEAAATKEDLNSYIERSLKLQEQIQVKHLRLLLHSHRIQRYTSRQGGVLRCVGSSTVEHP